MSKMSLIDEQTAYYRARASEYDEWFLRIGRYDRGADHRDQWNSELDVVREALAGLDGFPNTLAIACGTGLWTGILADKSESLTAIDSVEETILLNQKKNPEAKIDYIVTDIFEWEPSQTYDFIFFGFWLSHVPETHFECFWRTLQKSLNPGGCVFFVDSLKAQRATAHDHHSLDDSGVVRRQLNNGESYRIVKRFYQPVDLAQKLLSMGWVGDVSTTDEFFLYAQLRRNQAGEQEVGSSCDNHQD